MNDLISPPKLKGLNFNDKEIETVRKQNKLLMISIFTSKRCNLSCPYCYSNGGKSLPNELKLEEYKDIIAEGRKLSAKTVWIPGAGEPLLQEGFIDLVDFIDSLGMTLVFFTNGIMMDKKTAEYLIKRNVSVITKLNSFKPEIQDLLAGVKGAHKKIWQGLNNLIDVGFNTTSPTRLGIETIICRQNYKEIPDIFTFARNNDIYPYMELPLVAGRAKNNFDFFLSMQQERDLFYKLAKIDKTFNYIWTPVPPYVATRCDKLLYNILVNSVGDVQPCCAIFIKLGNIREKKLSEIMNNEIIRKLRNIKNSLHGNCGNCKIKECIYGCRSQAYIDGDLFGSYKRCWYTV